MEDIVTQIATFLKKPILIRIHGGAFIEFYTRHPKWVRRVLARATIINTPSRYLREDLSKLGFKVSYLPNFISIERFSFLRDIRNKYSLLWVRAFHEIYHPELAIEILNILRKKFPLTTLTMVGHDQGLLERCNRLIKINNLEEKIFITGKVPNDRLHKFYQSHAVFLTTTRYESFGVALVEAGACGIPCVSVAVGEIPYIWTDRENILFAERDPYDFAEKITELFENPRLANKISVNASKNAQQFTWDNVMPLWLDSIKCLSKMSNVRN